MRKIFLFFSVLIASALQVSAQNCLVVYYPFSGNANDAGPNGLNGIVSGATLTTDRFGAENNAYFFDGSTDYINLGNDALLKRYNSDYTINAWVNISSFSTNYQSMILSNRGENGEGSSVSVLGSLSPANDFGKLANIINGGSEATYVSSVSALTLDTWQMVTVTFKYLGNDQNEVKIYVNGSLVTTSTQKDVTDPGTLSTYLGFEPSFMSPSAYHFHGSIDDVRIYNCELDSQAVMDLYLDEQCMVAFYPFSGNANDASPNGLNGIVSGATLTTDRFGAENNAYFFDGSTDYINLGNDALLKRYNSDYTINAWVNISSFSTNYQSMILSNRGESGEGSSVSVLGSLSPANDFGKLANIINGGSEATYVSSVSALTLDTWQMVTVTFKYLGNDQNEVKIYVNGSLVTASIQKDVADPGALSTYLGFEPSFRSPSAYHFHGSIDDVRIFNCTLSEEVILSFYDLLLTGLSDTDLEKTSISIYPNPSSDRMYVLTENSANVKSITLFNSAGQEVLENSNSDSIDISELEKGIYMAIITTDNEISAKKLIIK